LADLFEVFNRSYLELVKNKPYFILHFFMTMFLSHTAGQLNRRSNHTMKESTNFHVIFSAYQDKYLHI